MKTIPIFEYNAIERTLEDSKLQKEQEIIISAFTECNMACTFCGDRLRLKEKPTKQGFDSRLRMLEQILPYIKEDIINIKFFGGELFQDKYDDSIYSLYDYFLQSLYLLCTNKTIKLSISTNLVCSNLDRPLQFLRKYKPDIRCSFDFSGRFTKQRQLCNFLKNLQCLKNEGLSPALAIIITQDLFESIKNSSYCELSKYWEYFYENYEISLDYYDSIDMLPVTVDIDNIDTKKEARADKLKLSEQELGEFFIYCIEHYPKVSNIQALLSSFKKKLSSSHCLHGYSITDRIYWECCNMKEVKQLFLQNKQCFLCKYYNNCIGTCYRVFAKEKACHLKLAYEYLEQNENSILKAD